VQVLPLELGNGSLESLGGFTDFVFACAIDRKHDRLAAAGQDSIIRVWDIRTRQTVAVLRRHMGDIRGLRFTDTGDLVSSGVDGRVVRWCHPDYVPIELVLPDVEFWACDVTDSQHCVTITTAGELIGVNLIAMAISWRRRTGTPEGRAVAVAKRGGVVFVGAAQDGVVERYSLQGEPMESKYVAPMGCFRSLSATYDDHLICAGENGRVAALSVRTGELARSWKAPTDDHVTAVGALSLETVLAGTASGQVWLFGQDAGEDGRLLVDWSERSRFDCRDADFRGARGINAYRTAALMARGALTR
jgi:WD40 repeat protein